jgi:ArsR family transcriptional regulator
MEKRAPLDDLRAAAGRAAEFLRLLANENRLVILCALGEGEMSVGALADELGTSQPNVSQHLAKLRALDLVAARRDGTTILYSLNSRDAAAIIGVLQRRYCPPPGKVPAAKTRAKSTTKRSKAA